MVSKKLFGAFFAVASMLVLLSLTVFGVSLEADAVKTLEFVGDESSVQTLNNVTAVKSATAINNAATVNNATAIKSASLLSKASDVETYKDLTYTVLDNETVQIVKYEGEKKNYTVPSKIDGMPVTVIGSHAFSGCPELETLTIPGSVRNLHDCAIAYCPRLKTVTVKDGNLKSIDIMDIYSCRNLKTVTLPKNITTFSFLYDCDAVEKVTFNSKNPEYKSYDGVVYSKDLKTLVYYPPGKEDTYFVVPSSVTTITRTAFNYARNLEGVYVPKTVKEIGETAFGYTRITIYYEGSKTPKDLEAAFYPWAVVHNSSPLDIPETLKMSSRTSGSVTIKWSAVPGATGYRVYIYDKENKSYETVVNTTKKSYKITDLDSITSYKFAVKAYVKTVSGTVWADKSEKITVRTLPETPDMRASYDDGEITLRWDKVSGSTGYVVYWSTSKNGAYKKLSTVKGTSYSTKKFDEEDTYYFKVRAYTKTSDGNVYSAYSSVKSVTVK